MNTDRSWPRTASHLANRLRRLGPALKRLGVAIDSGRTKRGRELSVVVTDGDGCEQDSKAEQEVFHFD